MFQKVKIVVHIVVPIYQYKAFNVRGKKIKGRINALNDFDFKDKMSAFNYIILSVKKKKESQKSNAKFSSNDLIYIFSYLERILRIGIPISDGLNNIASTTNKSSIREITLDIANRIRSDGALFYQAIAYHPKSFTPDICYIVKAGEICGRLHEMLGSISAMIEWDKNVQKSISQASRYPLFMLIMLCSMMGVIFKSILPKLLDFFASANMSLSMSTRSLIAFRSFVVNYGLYTISVIFLLILTHIILYRVKKNYKNSWDNNKLKLPFIGRLKIMVILTNFCRSFAIGLNADLGIIRSLELGKSVVANSVIEDAIEDVKKAVIDGISIDSALEVSGYFPEMLVRMVRIGAQSGEIGQMVQKSSVFYEEEANVLLESLVSLIRPLMVFISGGVLIWIISAVFTPMYKSMGSII